LTARGTLTYVRGADGPPFVDCWPWWYWQRGGGLRSPPQTHASEHSNTPGKRI